VEVEFLDFECLTLAASLKAHPDKANNKNINHIFLLKFTVSPQG